MTEENLSQNNNHNGQNITNSASVSPSIPIGTNNSAVEPKSANPINPPQEQANVSESPEIPGAVTTINIEHTDSNSGYEKIMKKGKLMLAIIGVIIFFMVFLLIILFAKKRNTTGKQVVLTYWGLWEDKDVMQPLIDEFEKTHPGIKINYIKQDFGFTSENYANVGTYYSSVLERLSKTGGVDIMRVHVSWIPNIVNLLYPAPNNIFPASEVQQNYYKPVVNASVFNNYVYDIPLYLDGLVMFYNPTLFKQANIQDVPQTWEDVVNDAPKLTKKQDNRIIQAGVAIGTGSNIFHSPETILMMFTQADVKVIDFKNKTFSFATDEATAAVKFYTDFAKKYQMWSYTLPSDLKMFSQCRLAMLFAPSWRAINFIASNPKLKFKVAPPPVLPGARPEVDRYIGSYYTEVVPRNAPHPKEAWIFLHWLSQPEQLQKFYQLQYQAHKAALPSPRKDVQQDVKIAPTAKTIHEMAPKMKVWLLYDAGIWEKSFREFLTNLESQQDSVTTTQLQELQNSLNQKIFSNKQ